MRGNLVRTVAVFTYKLRAYWDRCKLRKIILYDCICAVGFEEALWRIFSQPYITGFIKGFHRKAIVRPKHQHMQFHVAGRLRHACCGVASSINGGHIHDLKYSYSCFKVFISLKTIVFTVSEYEYMNLCPGHTYRYCMATCTTAYSRLYNLN